MESKSHVPNHRAVQIFECLWHGMGHTIRITTSPAMAMAAMDQPTSDLEGANCVHVGRNDGGATPHLRFRPIPKYGQKIGILTPKRWKIQQMGRWKRRKLFSDCLYLFANVAHRVDSHEPWVVQHWVFSMHILSLEWSTCECLQDSWVANAGCVPIGYQDAWFPHAVSDK